mgnify:CR=1 FL=1
MLTMKDFQDYISRWANSKEEWPCPTCGRLIGCNDPFILIDGKPSCVLGQHLATPLDTPGEKG